MDLRSVCDAKLHQILQDSKKEVCNFISRFRLFRLCGITLRPLRGRVRRDIFYLLEVILFVGYNGFVGAGAVVCLCLDSRVMDAGA